MEEDLERIRRANLSEEKRLQEDAEAAMRQEEIKAKSQGIGFRLKTKSRPYVAGILLFFFKK